MARILIDVLGADSPGARRHLEGFLPALARSASGHRFSLVLRESMAGPLAAGVTGGGSGLAVPARSLLFRAGARC